MNSDRTLYLNAVKQEVESHIFYHSLALEACLGGLYDHLKTLNRIKDSEAPKADWLLAGLVHDIDYSSDYKGTHPHKTTEVLAKYNLEISDSVLQIVRAHAPELTGVKPTSLAQWSIYCADSLTGLIVAVALIYPSRKLADVKASSVLKRFLKEPRFAAGTRRHEVSQCQNPQGLNLPLENFIAICLNSMKSVAPEIGL